MSLQDWAQWVVRLRWNLIQPGGWARMRHMKMLTSLRRMRWALLSVLSPLLLTACLSGSGPAEPTISDQPKNREVFVGQRATFDVGVSGAPVLSFQWARNGVTIAGATSARYITDPVTLEDDGASFTVTVSNESGSTTSAAAILTVKPGPSITSQPQSASVAEGASVTFTVEGEGEQLTYQWYRDETPIGGATAASYTLTAAATDDGAIFRALVINPGGFAVSEGALLTVVGSPQLSVQPVSQSVAIGDDVIFGVRAIGGELQYQWLRDGVAVAGATQPVLAVSAVTAAEQGSTWSVVVTNARGEVTSDAATLQVINENIRALSDANAQIALSKTSATVGSFTLVRRSDGQIASWGYRAEGQGGDGNFGNPSASIVTATLPEGRTATAIAAGGFHALALLDNGDVVSWGANDAGQLGLGDLSSRSTPAVVSLEAPAAAIAAGLNFSVAVLNDGRVFTWGSNSIGQLGDGSRQASVVPVEVEGVDQVTRVAAGRAHVLALRSDGSLWSWGDNGSGQLGDGLFKPALVPAATQLGEIVRIRAGGDQSAAISARGVLYLWGENGAGALALGASVETDMGVPTAVVADVVDVATGDDITLVLGADGLLQSAGANTSGSLGDGGTTARSSLGPVAVVSQGIALDVGGRVFAGAIAADGVTYLWGDNSAEQLGNESLSETGTATPTAVPSFDAIP